MSLAAPESAVPSSERLFERQPIRVNQNDSGGATKWAAILGGGALAALGLSRGSRAGLGLAALGGSLAYFGSGAWKGRLGPGKGIRIERSVTILRPREELYRFWRDLENLPLVMSHLKSVHCLDPVRSHWIVEGPLGDVEWDAEIHTEEENEFISWRALPGSPIDTAGTVHFIDAPGNRGTEVTVVLRYDSPAGQVGDALARLFQKSPKDQIHEDLRRFKQLAEAGETPTTQGQPSGRRQISRTKPR
jgi:uncharacterized membrane protein